MTTESARAVLAYDPTGRIVAAHFSRSPKPDGSPDRLEERARHGHDATVGVLHVAAGELRHDTGYRVDPATGTLVAVATGGTKVGAGSHAAPR